MRALPSTKRFSTFARQRLYQFSELGRVVVVESPALVRIGPRTRSHHQLVAVRRHLQTLAARTVLHEAGRVVVQPQLIAARAVTRVQDHVFAGVVDAGFVTTNFAFFGQQPVLLRPSAEVAVQVACRAGRES